MPRIGASRRSELDVAERIQVVLDVASAQLFRSVASGSVCIRQRATGFVRMGDAADLVADLEEAAVGLSDPVRVGDLEDRAGANARGVHRGEENVGVGVSEVVVATPPAADDVLAVAAQIVCKT